MDKIIGAGRIGTALAALSGADLITRNGNWETLSEATAKEILFICTRNDDLDGVLAKIPQRLHSQLCFVQNGMLSPWLEKNHIAGTTRAILYFAVSKLGESPNFGGESVVSGRFASLVCEKFNKWGIPSRVVDDSNMKKVEMEKLIWNSVFGLLGEESQSSVGHSLENQEHELDTIVGELVGLVAKKGIVFEKKELLKSLKDYAHSVSDYQARIKEWSWRNQWFFTAAREEKLEVPLWNELHRRVKLP